MANTLASLRSESRTGGPETTYCLGGLDLSGICVVPMPKNQHVDEVWIRLVGSGGTYVPGVSAEDPLTDDNHSRTLLDSTWERAYSTDLGGSGYGNVTVSSVSPTSLFEVNVVWR